MIGQYLITFREVLEAALIISIVLAYLTRTDRSKLSRYVWYGVLSAIFASVIIGIIIWFVYGSLSSTVKVFFEGVAALIAVVVLSLMIFWMAAKGRELKSEVERRVEDISTRGTALGLVSFAFIIVFREGIETVLFLTPFLVTDMIATISGLTLGLMTSLGLAYGIFVLGMKINIRRFFYFTSILLIFLAGGLLGYGVHELIEYSRLVGMQLGWLGDYAYVLSVQSGSLLHHKGAIGSVLAVMFGYTVKAEWLRVVLHFAYIVIALPLVTWIYKK
jgi:high-affinity iron transporter